MPMSPTRWTAISESRFPWERDALEWLRSQLPDHHPWHAWTNFEFIDDEGRVNEVDALILTPVALYLMEIKSRPGVLTGDPHTWTWTTDGKSYSDDNPLILGDRKAKRLASLLRRLSSVRKSRVRLPFIRPCVFLSAAGLVCKLSGTAAAGVYLRGQPGSPHDDGIIAALTGGGALIPSGDGHRIDQTQARALAQAMAQAGIRPSNKHRLVGDYRLGALLSEGETWQDWEGRHRSIEGILRRVRIYPYATAATAQARAALVRQAAREFQILEGIDHPGILKVRDYKEGEQGPALIFDHDPRARRLDLLLREHGERLNVSQRLHLVRHLAETLQYAHGKRLFHRALCPQSILVRDPEARFPSLQIMNWQTGARDAGTGTAAHRTVGTLHVQDAVEDPGRVYLAPEGAWQQQVAPDQAPDSDGADQAIQLDVFSLGAIAYHLFSGQPPATNVIEQLERLRAGPGLNISAVMDGAVPALQDLIQLSTLPDTSARYPTVDDVLKALDVLEDALTTPDPEVTVDPAIATTNDRLDGGFTVLRRLGKGSSADVLLVRPDGGPDGTEAELVLKVASDPAHNERLVAEGEALAKLRRNPNVVEWHRTLVIAGRTALLLSRAGDHTLAKRLEDDMRLSLDLASRFGEELIQVVDCLEGLGIAHRDIKPHNIGIARGPSGRLQLVLFDFSLTSAAPEHLTAGTHPYLDPFLPLRRPPRWDLAAERFAVAVTLYEMLTGDLPRWGDGVSQAAMLECEVSLNTDLFDPHLRDALTDFFAKALRRDYRERFDNAEEMLRAWRQAFAGTQDLSAGPEDLAARARLATAATSIAELGYSVEAQNVLDGMGIHNLHDLLAVDRIKFRYLSGVGDRIRKEIRLKAKRLLQLRPDLGPAPPPHPNDARTTVPTGEAPGIASIDTLAAQLLPQRPAGADPVGYALRILLGLEPAGYAMRTLRDPVGYASRTLTSRTPTLGDAARAAGLTRAALSDALLKARERWLKLPTLTQVRGEIATLLEAHAGVMTIPELALVLLAARGSANQDDAQRLRLATAVVRACSEAEGTLAQPRYQVFAQDPDGCAPLIAVGTDHADYARRLGASADAIALADPLPAPPHVRKTLEDLERPATIPPLATQRLLRLATAASRTAALSSRQEVYPRGLPVPQALRLSLGALTGPRCLQVTDIRARIQGRYPECAPIPGRPELDALLAAAGAALTWDSAGPLGAGYYPPAGGSGPSAGTTTWLTRYTTQGGPAADLSAEAAQARQFADRLDHARTVGGFLALTVLPRLARHAEAQLLRRYGSQRLNLDALLIQTLRDQAQRLRVDWEVVVQADAAAPGSRDWTNLTRLVQKALPQFRQRLLAADQPTLLVNPGLLARYQLMGLIEALRDRTGADTPPVWLLVPMHTTGLPAVDGAPVPVISSAQWARIPPAWIEQEPTGRNLDPL